MRKTISVAALLVALTCSVYAGDIQNDSPAASQSQPTARGDIQNDVTGTLTQIALDLLAALF